MRNPLARLRTRSEAEPSTGPRLRRLTERVNALEAAVEENRRLNQRLADVVDVVTEVLVPAADRDDARMQEALARLNKTLDDG